MPPIGAAGPSKPRFPRRRFVALVQLPDGALSHALEEAEHEPLVGKGQPFAGAVGQYLAVEPSRVLCPKHDIYVLYLTRADVVARGHS